MEAVVEVGTARSVEQRRALRPGLCVEQARGPIEPASGDARQCRHLRGGQLGRACSQPLLDGAAGQAPEGNELAARANRLGERPELVGDEDERRVGGRLLEVLEQRRRRLVVHPVRVEEQVDPPVALEGAHVEVVVERPDLVDPDHLAERLDHPQVGMRPRGNPARVAEEDGGEGARGRPLAHPRGAVEEVGV